MSWDRPKAGLPLWQRGPDVLCIAGDSGAGKTTLIEGLMCQPALLGRRIGLIKHTHHRLDWHPPAKDSTRFWKTRAEGVVVVDPTQSACFRRPRRSERVPQEPDPGPHPEWDRGARKIESDTRALANACRLLESDVDLILAEGFSSAAAPRLWVTIVPPDGQSPRAPSGAVVTTRGLIMSWAQAHPRLEIFDRNDHAGVAAAALRWASDLRDLALN